MLAKATLRQLLQKLNTNSRVLMRTDYNVPIKNDKIQDLKRITSTIPTIQQIMKKRPKSLVILSHMGRPQGQKIPQLSLKPIVPQLQKSLNHKVIFLEDCIGDEIINRVNKSQGEIFLCENVRYHGEETGSIQNKDKTKIKISPEKIQKFRDQLSLLGDCYVNDAFGTVHRAHSSVVGINHKYKVAGLLLQKEIKFLGGFLENPKKPVLVILGGSKVSDKILLIKNLTNLANQMIIDGGLKNPFLTHVYKRQMGDSINIMPKNPNQLTQILQLAKQRGVKINFPVDYKIAKQIKNPTQIRNTKQGQPVPKGYQVLDIGPQACKQYEKLIMEAGSIFWNGPVGVVETDEFRSGSVSILNNMIKATQKGTITIIGGGDSANLVEDFGVEDKISFVSTGGGATITLLQGKQLPGVSTLSNKDQLQK